MRSPGGNGAQRPSQQTRRGRARSAANGISYCSAARARTPIPFRWNKPRQINTLTGYHTILTWLDVVSMVRAAFEGDGALFPSTADSFGLHSMAEGTNGERNGS